MIGSCCWLVTPLLRWSQHFGLELRSRIKMHFAFHCLPLQEYKEHATEIPWSHNNKKCFVTTTTHHDENGTATISFRHAFSIHKCSIGISDCDDIEKLCCCTVEEEDQQKFHLVFFFSTARKCIVVFVNDTTLRPFSSPSCHCSCCGNTKLPLIIVGFFIIIIICSSSCRQQY